jgi:hypothetical protein
MSNELTTTNVEFQDYEISQSDIVIPKILLMQPISDMVSQDKAKYGDFVNSLTNEVISDCIKGIDVIPLSIKKYHIVSKKEADGKFKFLRIDPITCAADEAKPYYDTEGEFIIERKNVLDFYVLAPDICELPFSLQFKGMSIKTGKAFYTTSFVLARAAKKMPFEKTFTILAKKTKGEKGNFAVLDFKVKGPTSQDNIRSAMEWYATVNNKSTVITTEVEQEPEQTSMAF